MRLSSLSRSDKGGCDESDGAAGDAERVFCFSNQKRENVFHPL